MEKKMSKGLIDFLSCKKFLQFRNLKSRKTTINATMLFWTLVGYVQILQVRVFHNVGTSWVHFRLKYHENWVIHHKGTIAYSNTKKCVCVCVVGGGDSTGSVCTFKGGFIHVVLKCKLKMNWSLIYENKVISILTIHCIVTKQYIWLLKASCKFKTDWNLIDVKRSLTHCSLKG